MSTKNEVKEEKIKVENNLSDSSAQEPMPSIWYT